MTTEQVKSCFVIMPIADTDGYEKGHFSRVYHHIIKPACEMAGFIATRADDVKNTNMIILDIIKKIVNADMVVCDLSSRNPNVMYELGIRQAFNLPVALIKDSSTNRIFDISSLRDVEYDSSLRIDTVTVAVANISNAITATYENKSDTNSLIQLLGINAAKIPDKMELNPDTSILLNAIEGLSQSIRNSIENTETRNEKEINRGTVIKMKENVVEYLDFKKNIGHRVFHERLGEGVIVNAQDDSMDISVEFNDKTVKRIGAPYKGLDYI
ncbi:hypothetical protein ACFFNY_20865 [Paenibacillus hodogayensis]|uniref:Uncharacterized protein n=1 Tax=Paenibacillus hodogayensis TaxID=279208 RepID=A0ABV5W132_9BACL